MKKPTRIGSAFILVGCDTAVPPGNKRLSSSSKMGFLSGSLRAEPIAVP